MAVQFVSRAAWFAGTPTNNNGTPRPKLAPLRPQMTRHYTGSPVSTKASTWAAKDWMPWFQTVAMASGKSMEYNYVIPPRADGSSQVWEYAGTYQAAHSAGENDVSVGVLFAIGVNNHPSYFNYDPNRPTQWEPITPPMIEAYRYLRDEILIRQGIVAPTVAEIDHKNMPGAATACPGVEIVAHHAELSKPYSPAPPPPAEDHDMIRIRIDGYQDQMMLVPIANLEALRKMGLETAPLHVMTPQTSRADLERDLGYPLTPI